MRTLWQEKKFNKTICQDPLPFTESFSSRSVSPFGPALLSWVRSRIETHLTILPEFQRATTRLRDFTYPPVYLWRLLLPHLPTHPLFPFNPSFNPLYCTSLGYLLRRWLSLFVTALFSFFVFLFCSFLFGSPFYWFSFFGFFSCFLFIPFCCFCFGWYLAYLCIFGSP